MSFSASKAQDFLKNYEKTISDKIATSATLSDPRKYDAIQSNIKNVASSFFPGSSVEIHFYGSRIIGLGAVNSDLDIFVDIGGRFNTEFSHSPDNDARFWKLASAVGSNKDWRVTKKVLKTGVPVIKAVYLPLQLDCDIIMTNGLSACHTRVLAHLFSLQPEAKKLFHFIKSWLHLHGCQFLGFTITLLVVFYLQSLNFMPSIKTVQLNLPKQLIGKWEVQFDKSRSLSSYGVSLMTNYKNSIPGFFKFYSNFNYDKVMSTLTGSPVDSHSHKLNNPKFRLQGLLIAGPFNQEKNCGIIDTIDKENFIQLCRESKNFFDENNL